MTVFVSCFLLFSVISGMVFAFYISYKRMWPCGFRTDDLIIHRKPIIATNILIGLAFMLIVSLSRSQIAAAVGFAYGVLLTSYVYGTFWLNRRNIDLLGPLTKDEMGTIGNIQIWPREPRVRRRLYEMAVAAGRPDSAERWILSALRVAPGDVESHVAIADFYLRRRDIPKAKAAVDRLAALASDNKHLARQKKSLQALINPAPAEISA